MNDGIAATATSSKAFGAEVQTTPSCNAQRVNFAVCAVYIAAIGAAVSVWFLAIRAPLWLDETSSYWSIAGGFKQVWIRSTIVNSFPPYLYILWLTKTLFGAREIVLRLPSLLAMAAASYLFYRAARELFAREVALIATLFFVLDKRIVFAAIDVRPYPFAMLATTAAILCYLRWSKTPNSRYAAQFGISVGGIFYFHYLFGCCMVVAFTAAYIVAHWPSLFGKLSQVGIALACFGLLIIPVLPRIWDLQQRKGALIFAAAPAAGDFLRAIAPGVTPYVVIATIFLAALIRRLSTPDSRSLRHLALCVAVGPLPLLVLYLLSVATPLHVFIERYQAVAVPGIALFWGWPLSQVDSRSLRMAACVIFVTCSAYLYYKAPESRNHSYTWKYALEAADASAAQDRAPLVICSDYPDADFRDMPESSAEESDLFAPLSYYKVHTAVIPLPRALNAQAQALGRKFFLSAAVNRQRFVALCFRPSYPTLDWLVGLASVTHSAHVIGVYDGIAVVEFRPRTAAAVY